MLFIDKEGEMVRERVQFFDADCKSIFVAGILDLCVIDSVEHVMNSNVLGLISCDGPKKA